MITHMVMYRFKADCPTETRLSILSEQRSLPARFPAMRDFSLGKNISAIDSRFEYGFCATFDHIDDLNDYLESDWHIEFAKQKFRPVVEERSIVTFEL